MYNSQTLKDFEIISRNINNQKILFHFIINRNTNFNFQISNKEIENIYDFANSVINGKNFTYKSNDFNLSINKEIMSLNNNSTLLVYDNNYILRNAFRRFYEEKNNWYIIEKDEKDEKDGKEKRR